MLIAGFVMHRIKDIDPIQDTLRKIAQAGCVHLSKPTEPETLTQQIQGFLAAKQRPKSGKTARQADLSATGGPRPTVFVVDDDRTLRDVVKITSFVTDIRQMQRIGAPDRAGRRQAPA